jgi:hypothetical protein
VVSDVGWFSELPDEVALKVPPEHDSEAVGAALDVLLSDDSRRAAAGAAAARLAQTEHELEAVADRYAAALEEAAGGASVRDAVLRDVSQAAAEVGIGPADPEARELAHRLREAGLGDH